MASANRARKRKLWMVAALAGGTVAAIVLVGGMTYRAWGPSLLARFHAEPPVAGEDSTAFEDRHVHGGHTHAHPGHAEESAIELSVAGLKNIDYEPVTVGLGTFERTITLPAMVVERPGHSQVYITAPLAGVVTRILAVEGAAVEPGRPMFEVRLMHDELVNAQRSFLQTLENLDVVQSEIERLRSTGEGVIAGRRILEQQYEQQKLQAALRADRQALLLHGLTSEQVRAIEQTRQLLQALTIYAPEHIDVEEKCHEEHLFHVQKLPVQLGEHVQAGQLLCVLADHCELYIEGRAFEDDAIWLRAAAREGRSVTARVVVGRRETDVIEGLKLLYLADQVDPDTRVFRFYVRLPNAIALDQMTEDGRRFITWRFNPGQRMELQVPVERWPDRIVLPVEAVVQEGAEAFVYQRNGDHFDRVAVHVEYRDQTRVVIANDGAIRPGDVVAGKGAYQMHLALRNKSGTAADPHAGHHH